MIKRILPAYPIFVKDPNFSFWSASEELNESNIQSWWGEEKKIYGFLKLQGQTHCFLGRAKDFENCNVKKAEQISLKATSFSTDYSFKVGNAILKIRFVSPLPPDDIALLSLPVCYLEYEVENAENAEVSIFVNRSVSFNDIPENNNKEVRGGVVPHDGFESAFLGLKRQMPLSNNDDTIGADWGYFYLSGEKAEIVDQTDLAAYLSCGSIKFSCVGAERYLCSRNTSLKSAVMLGYDDLISIDYFGRYLKGYYLNEHTIVQALEYVWKNRKGIGERLAAFDGELKRQAKKYGKEYYDILCASLRQSIAAHKLVKDGEGNVLFLSKECHSCGCIATADVSYPSMPLYLLYNPALVKGMMLPVLKFARMPVWPYEFAPHDVGTYPICCGQVYGLSSKQSKYFGKLLKEGYAQTHFPIYLFPKDIGLYDLSFQMPVEECANMLIMFLAYARFGNDIGFFERHYDLAERWSDYLARYGLKPEFQNCTDDFTGHLKNNLNLAIKATVGIASFAELASLAGRKDIGNKYRKTAERFAKEISSFEKQFKHLPLTWDSGENTFSLKYNLAFDKILNLGLFDQAILEREVDCYLERLERYGTPLDSRADYTKSDWLMWAASLTDSIDKKARFIKALDHYLKESPQRVPFGDWYDAKKGEQISFLARSVQGGCFILLLGQKS